MSDKDSHDRGNKEREERSKIRDKDELNLKFGGRCDVSRDLKR